MKKLNIQDFSKKLHDAVAVFAGTCEKRKEEIFHKVLHKNDDNITVEAPLQEFDVPNKNNIVFNPNSIPVGYKIKFYDYSSERISKIASSIKNPDYIIPVSDNDEITPAYILDNIIKMPSYTDCDIMTGTVQHDTPFKELMKRWSEYINMDISKIEPPKDTRIVGVVGHGRSDALHALIDHQLHIITPEHFKVMDSIENSIVSFKDSIADFDYESFYPKSLMRIATRRQLRKSYRLELTDEELKYANSKHKHYYLHSKKFRVREKYAKLIIMNMGD